MIQIAIVEDEERYVNELRQYIERYQKESGRKIKITTFSDGEDITENYHAGFDIILMDIQMHFMDGMTAAEKIRQFDKEVIIMFITNMIQYAVRGYEVDAMDYVVKPVEYFSFSQKLDKAIGRLKSKKKEYITISVGDGILKLGLSDILYIESQGHNAIFSTRSGEYISRVALKDLEKSLVDKNFFRCGKGYLVNMKQVDGVSGSDCLIRDLKIPISRAKKKEFMDLLLQYMNED